MSNTKNGTRVLMTAVAVAAVLSISPAPVEAQSNDYVFGASGTWMAELFLNGTQFDAFDQGWYDGNSTPANHAPSNTNYVVGYVNGEYNNFFAWDLGNLTSTIFTASLRLNTELVGDFDGLGNLVNFFDYTGSIDDLVGATGNTDATHADLGSGVFYGSYLYTEADENSWVTVNLNANAVAGINAAAGGRFALGGTMAPSPQVPEPTSLLLMASGLLGLGAVVLRRQEDQRTE